MTEQQSETDKTAEDTKPAPAVDMSAIQAAVAAAKADQAPDDEAGDDEDVDIIGDLDELADQCAEHAKRLTRNLKQVRDTVSRHLGKLHEGDPARDALRMCAGLAGEMTDTVLPLLDRLSSLTHDGFLEVAETTGPGSGPSALYPADALLLQRLLETYAGSIVSFLADDAAPAEVKEQMRAQLTHVQAALERIRQITIIPAVAGAGGPTEGQ